MTNRNPAPQLLLPLDELDLQIGTGLVASIADSGIRKICELRSRLAQGGMRLPLARVRDKATLAPYSFRLHQDERGRSRRPSFPVTQIRPARRADKPRFPAPVRDNWPTRQSRRPRAEFTILRFTNKGAFQVGLEAERGGFEPPRDLRPCRFSRPVHSTALPPL